MADFENALAWHAPSALQDWVGSGSHWLHKARRRLGLGNVSRFAPHGLGLGVAALCPGSVEKGLALVQGHFDFAGHRVTTAPGRIFQASPPSTDWWNGLASLGWLNDLAATGQEIARITARKLLESWQAEALPRISAPVAARALINLSRTAYFTVATAPAHVCFDFAHMIEGLCRRMAGRWPASSELALEKAVALATATTAFRMQPAAREAAHAQLAKALQRVILPDGGHVSRNACKLVDLALDLVPLRISMQASRTTVPPSLNAAIERMMPMLRMLCLGDNGLACLQGAAPRREQLTELFAADASQGRPLTVAPHAGFSRLAFNDAVLVIDTGLPLDCQSTLAFEFSHGLQRIITSCGTSAGSSKAWGDAMCRSAAHSTWDNGGSGATVEPRVAAEVISSPQGALLKTSHETARRHQRTVHQRNLFLASTGLDLRGEEQVTAPHGKGGELLRFHLHPAVHVETSPHPNCVALTLPTGETWTFSQAGGVMTIEDSVHLGDDAKPQPSKQLTLKGVQASGLHIQWALRRARTKRGNDPVRKRFP